MSEPRRMLEAIREELRTTVLPRIEGDYERSVVIAMLGILRDLGPALVLDERGTVAENERLRAALDEAVAKLGERPLATSTRERLADADREASATSRYARLLAAAESLIRDLWRDPALGAERRLVLPILRSALKP